MKRSPINQHRDRFLSAVTLTLFLVTFICFLGSVFLGCTEDRNAINASNLNGNPGQLLSTVCPGAPGNPQFGDMLPLNSYPEQIIPYGPGSQGKGWHAIWLPTIPVNDPWVKSLYTNAKSAGYYPIIANIERNDILNNNWTAVNNQIDFAKAQLADWIYVDDALSGDSTAPSRLSLTQIDTVAKRVHNVGQWKPLATAEWDVLIMQANPTWHNNVDIIMPYHYGKSPTQLNSFYSFVRSNYAAQLVPILGYHVWFQNRYVYQKGLLGGGTAAYIETASDYSSLIIYYTDGDWNSFTNLTAYLRSYYRMGNGFIDPR